MIPGLVQVLGVALGFVALVGGRMALASVLRRIPFAGRVLQVVGIVGIVGVLVLWTGFPFTMLP